jgi:hypothetical protein
MPVLDLEIDDAQLEMILDKVDAIAERMDRRDRGSNRNQIEDDREVWKQFRKELVKEGFSSDILEQHKDVLRAYIREMDQESLLAANSMAVQPPAKQTSTSSQSRPIIASEEYPPSFSSLGISPNSTGTKEMMVDEDNIKFPSSMKFERPKPETRGDPGRRHPDEDRYVE